MMIKKKICPDCKKEFDFDTLARFPRKYCLKCSAERKKEYANIANIKIEDCKD
jgi:hypothetical protein